MHQEQQENIDWSLAWAHCVTVDDRLRNDLSVPKWVLGYEPELPAIKNFDLGAFELRSILDAMMKEALQFAADGGLAPEYVFPWLEQALLHIWALNKMIRFREDSVLLNRLIGKLHYTLIRAEPMSLSLGKLNTFALYDETAFL